MKNVLTSLFLAVLAACTASAPQEIDVFIVAGQSNAQGWKGDAAEYPTDPNNLDRSIRFYWVTPKYSSSKDKWTTLRPQGGLFKTGHFGLEVSFARSLKKAGYNPAIFKYSLSSTSIATNWKGPGDGGMYDQMVGEFGKALALLKKDGHTPRICGFVWIQGESDAKTRQTAEAYKVRLRKLIDDLRENVTKQPKLPIVLGVDEQNRWVKKNPQVVQSQQDLAKEDGNIVFTSMVGLEKADGTHLTPKGLEDHGKRIYAAYADIAEGQQENQRYKR